MPPVLRHASWLLPWGALAAWCVSGFAPAVDLPAHAAQLQTLAELLRGSPEVARVYEAHAPLGYGLPTWLFLPLALATHGAVAARVALWTALMGLPLSLLALARALGRPASPTLALLSLPFAFNVSYWYGFLPTLFALPLVLLGLAAYARAEASMQRPPLAPLVGLALLALATMASHVVALGALAAGVGGLALAAPAGRRRRALGLAALGLSPALLVGGTRLALFAGRVVEPGAGRVPTDYGAGAHVSWFFRNFRVEGLLSVALPVALCLGLAALALHRREGTAARRPWALFLAFLALYVAAPKAVSGAWLIHARFASLVGLAALLLVDVGRLPRWVRGALLALTLLSLAETARFHARFAREVAGLAALTASPAPPGPHGYVTLQGVRVAGSRLPYLEHAGQWWTAQQGGVGHHLFGDADHVPVRFRPGVSLPQRLEAPTREQLVPFRALLVWGEGALPPEVAAGFTETAHAGRWRRLERR